MGLPEGRDRPDHRPSSPHESGAGPVRGSRTSGVPRISGSYSYHPDQGGAAPQPPGAPPPTDERPTFPPLPRGEDLFEELERMPLAILLLGPGNSLVFANRTGRLLLSAKLPFLVRDNRVRCPDRVNEVKLARAVDNCIRAARFGEQQRERLSLVFGEQSFDAVVLPSTRATSRRPAAVVMVRTDRKR